MNKKIILSSALLACCMGASAQHQLPNGDFEQGTRTSGSNTVPNNWGWFDTATGGLGSIAKGNSYVNVETYENSENHYVKVTQGFFLVPVNGNLTTGIIHASSVSAADATGNYNYSDPTNNVGQTFTGKPDSVSFKYNISKSGNERRARLKIVIHGAGRYQDPEGDNDYSSILWGTMSFPSTTTNGWQTATQPFTLGPNAASIAPAAVLVSLATDEEPGKGSKGDYISLDDLVFIYNSELASLSYGGTSLLQAGQTAYDLSDQAYDESQLSCSANGIGASVETSYDDAAALLTITVKGNDWTEENPANQHTYTVQFKQQAAPGALSDVKVSGMAVEGFDPSVTSYTLPYAYNPGIVVEGTPAEGSTIVTELDPATFATETAFYDNEAKTITVKVQNAEGETTDYVFSFTDAVAESQTAGTYAGSLAVTLATEDSESTTPLDNSPITLTENANGTYNLSIYNFTFGGMQVGTIYVPAVTATDGVIEARPVIRLTALNADGTTADGAIGPMLGHLTLNVQAKLLSAANKEMEASIDILTGESDNFMVSMFKNIHVEFTPLTVSNVESEQIGFSGPVYYRNITASGRLTKQGTTLLQINNVREYDGELYNLPMGYIDLSGAAIDDDVTAADILAGSPEKNNTLVYLPASSQLSGTNFVKGDEAENVVITDSVYFRAPKAFTAQQLTYNRKQSMNEMTTLVLPFSASADALAANVYELASCEEHGPNFVSLGGDIQANTPYLINATGEQLLSGALENAYVEATPEEMKAEVEDLTLAGTYESKECTPEDEKPVYEVASYEMQYYYPRFVRMESESTVPFRAYLTIEAADGPGTYDIYIDGTTSVLGGAAVETEGTTDVYSLGGVLLRKNVPAARALDGLSKGIYVVGGKKVVK